MPILWEDTNGVQRSMTTILNSWEIDHEVEDHKDPESLGEVSEPPKEKGKTPSKKQSR